MTALELADYMENTERWNVAGVQMQNCAEMLRRQHEAIVKLRDALNRVIYHGDTLNAWKAAEQALKDTEGLA